MTFDINLQKVDRSISGVFFADRGERACLDREATHIHAEVFALLGDGGVCGGKTCAGNTVKGHFARVVAGDALYGDVAWALLTERGVVILHRLDVYALPAMVVERFGDGVVARIVGAHVDVETVFELLERTPQADIFKVLCKRDERHGRFLSVSFSCSAYAGGAFRLCIARLTHARKYSMCMLSIRRLCRLIGRLCTTRWLGETLRPVFAELFSFGTQNTVLPIFYLCVRKMTKAVNAMKHA